jgi:DNA-binding transcriptional LysR family regulator
MFESGAIDLALGHWPKLSTRRGFHRERLFAESFACVVRHNHPVIGRTTTLKQFSEAQHLIITTDGNSDGMVERTLSRNNLSRKVSVRVPHFLAIPGILENSDLIATIPLGVAKLLAVRHRLRIMPPPLEIPHFEVGQYWHKRFHHEPGLTWLRTVIHEFFSERHGAAS